MNDYQGYSLTQPGPTLLPKPRRKRYLRFFLIMLFFVICTFVCWFYFSTSGTNYRYMIADTLITTQHRDYAKYLIGENELNRRVDEYMKKFDAMGMEKDNHNVLVSTKKNNEVTVEPITNNKYKGYLLYVHNPKMIRVVTTSIMGQGEQILSMVKRTGAIAGVNGGAFDDPNYDGNGFRPIGIVMADGKLLYSDGGMEDPVNVVGLDRNGVMVAGRYKPSELVKMGVKDAVTFQPKFIVNGKGLIKNEADGWGIAPRTCMAQTKDGTIIFLVIDGRQPGYSIGATLYDAQQLLLKKGAVTAANLDGGSSSVLVNDGRVVNRPSSSYGMRYLPTAFLVFDHPEKVVNKNMWSGINMSNYDSSNKPFAAKQ
jgi:exopolysaccharide biosynthesis protein